MLASTFTIGGYDYEYTGFRYTQNINQKADEDNLFHLNLDTRKDDLQAMFSDVKVIRTYFYGTATSATFRQTPEI